MHESEELLVIIRHAPHNSNWLREGLDAALVGAAFGQSVRLLFMGQGALALCREQQAGAPGQKASLPTIDMLEMYDIDQLNVPQRVLDDLKLPLEALVDGVTPLSEEQVKALFSQNRPILNF
ncbi:DsrE family protein [Vreelandella janggokensis]|uniref:DsrE family protein n=1 Tax=Vreelandella janggokensis TaxID=370767 RepID=UPI0028583AE2|nr:DsrE family protein [Halomonas janggokensis]MDR5885570.1 DsrE family protein [Halomonas janggokensis]